ncbi:geranylgeranyl reductase family protein [Methanococcus voltae]|uniref:Geranylgeranyl reductase n=1 Tax=Methanococcus voltae (strain ATCC BAA-1334 / A3) TaxID=456320 RepID=D7DT51_METV3|nr:NAD(P)/FAD-dependent oxidoreductase [Methanococcus voltae]MCS3901833.1 geranylgeranyl reductase family protein [Methanococcus voltae]
MPNLKINNQNEQYDVIIVGGGPAGFITAENIQKDLNVLVVEEHQSIGVPIQCAGLLSKKGFNELGNPKGIVNKVRGANIFCEKQNLTVGDDNKIRAMVFERKEMDKDIAKRALKNKNVNLMLKSHGKILNETTTNKNNKNSKNSKNNSLNKKHIIEVKNNLKDEKYIFSPKIIVGADGVRSGIGKSLKMHQKREIITGVQIEYVNVSNIDSDFVNVFYDKRYSSNFFTWIIPTGKDRVRVGMCDTKDALNKLNNFIATNENAKEILKGATPIEYSIGAIPLGYNSKSVLNNVMLVGDAVNQVKPLSGGGLYFGAKCAKLCANTINEYYTKYHTKFLNEENANLDYLKTYEELWKSEIGKEINYGLKMSYLMNKLNNKKIDKILKYVIDKNLIDYINNNGEMDKPSEILKKVVEASLFGKKIK